MSDRSIENYIEPVLSAYVEWEQGQSGAYIRRPYTGAEKGKETMLADNCKNDYDNVNDEDDEISYINDDRVYVWCIKCLDRALLHALPWREEHNRILSANPIPCSAQ